MSSIKDALDADWAEKLSQLVFGTTSLMNQKFSHQLEQKLMFLADEIDFPNFDYSHIRRHKFDELKEKYEQFLLTVQTDTEHDPIVRKFYEDVIKERLVEIELILLISTPRTDISEDEFVSRFNQYNKTLFGDIDQTYFNDVLAELQVRLRLLSTRRPELIEGIEKFLEKYASEAKAANFPRVQFDKPLVDINLKPLKDAAAVKAAFDEALKNEGLAEDWRTVIDTTGKRKTISVGNSTQQIYIPNDTHYARLGKKNAVGALALQKLIAHEIHAHVHRLSAGAHSPLRLLGIGLAQSRQAEEGVATFFEQQLVADNSYFAGYLSYFITGIAHGLDRKQKPRTFKEVFMVMKELFLLFHANNEEVAEHLAYDRCMRIYRGTHAKTPGVVLHKDLFYRAGNISIHKLLSRQPEAMPWVFLGRFDPTNEEQTTPLIELGIIEPL